MHDLAEDHDHPDFADLGPDHVMEDVEGLEMFTLKSVGIDIGSSTSHVVFSRLTLRRQGASLSARFTVTDRTVLFRSAILLTPYLSGTLIDVDTQGQPLLDRGPTSRRPCHAGRPPADAEQRA